MSKRRGSPYVSGSSPHWLKLKNPNSAAVLMSLSEPFYQVDQRATHLLLFYASESFEECMTNRHRQKLYPFPRVTAEDDAVINLQRIEMGLGHTCSPVKMQAAVKVVVSQVEKRNTFTCC